MRKVLQLTFSFSFLICAAIFAQPANDNCSGATSLGTLAGPAACPSGVGANTNFNGTLVGATPGNPYIYQPGCAGGSTSTVSNDVWYTFTASSYHAVITVNSTFANPAITFYSGTCGALGGGIGGCAVGSGGTVTLTVDQMVPGTTYILQISGNGTQTGTFTGTIHNNNDCSGCMQSSVLTPNPLPVNGAYTPGQVVQFCYHISNYLQANTNWMHGVQVSFGSGWVGTPANLNATNTTSPPSWSNDGGSWAYYPAGITATLGTASTADDVAWPAGFYYNTGGGGPGNNFGDAVTPYSTTVNTPVPAGEWNFCFTLTVDPGCSPGSDLSVTVNTSGDGESGGWNNNGCNSDDPSVAPAIGACCQPTMTSAAATCVGNDGTATATPVGTAGPYDYIWTGPGGYTSSTANVAGANTISGLAPGTYTVGITDANNCQVFNTVTVAGGGGAPPAPTTAPVSYCQNATAAALTATPSAGGTLNWYGTNATGGTASATAPTPSTATVTTTTYYVSQTVGGCEGPRAPLVVTINSLPVATATANSPCVGQALTLTGGPAGMTTYSWTGVNTGASQNLNIASASAANAGVSTLTVTNANGCQGSASVTVTVNALPVATASANTPCVGQALTLTGGPAGMTTYSWTGVNTGATQNLNIASASAANAGVSTLTVTNANGCQGSANVTVTVNAGPTATATANTPCVGQALTLTGGPAGMSNYSWTGVNTGTTQNLNIASASAANAGVSTLTITDANGCQGSANVTVTVNAGPTATATANTPCVGQALTLTGGPAGMSSYSWTGVNTGATQNLNIASASAANAGVSTLTVTDANGCQGSVNVTVTVNALPIATATANTPCVGQALTLTGGPAGMSNYSWTGVNTGATQNLNITSASAANAGVSTLTVTDANGCQGSANVTVTVNALPVATATANTPCAGQALTLTGGPAGMSNYSWTGVNTGATQNLNIASASAANAGVSTLTVTDANGCQGSANVTVTVNALPVATATANTPCAGQALTLTGGPAGMSNYSWTGVNTGATQNLNIPSASAANAGVSTLTVTDANGCQGSANVTVTVNALPVATATSNTPCAGQALTLTGGPAGMSNYTWTGVNTGNTQNLTIASASAANAGVSTLTVTDANGCQGSVNITVNINASPVANAGADASVCAGNNATLTGSGAGSGSYSWLTNAGIVSTNSSFTAAPSADTWYELTVTDANGCQDKDSVRIKVNPLPLVNYSSTTICQGDSTRFTNTSADTSGGTFTSFWSFGNGVTSNIKNPSLIYAACGNYNVTLIVTTNNNCQDAITKSVNVNCVPTATFTTNTVCFPAATSFNNTSSISGGSYLSSDWDFNFISPTHTTDDTLQNPSHQFTAGTYAVDLIVSTGAGCKDTVTNNVTVNPKPNADFSTSSVCLNQTTNFTDLSSVSSPDNIASWNWDFDNNGTTDASGQTGISNIYTGLPPITATLIVSSNNGCKDTVSKSVTVYPLPVAAFTVAPVCEGTASQFINNSSITAGSISTNQWIFNTATGTPTSNLPAPSNTYPASGSYPVQLHVTSNNGCVDSVVVNAIVNPNPVVNFSADVTSGCEPLCINLSDLSTISTTPPGSVNSTFSWIFGDGNTASGANQSHCYQNDGSYDVTLTVTTNNNCTSTLFMPAYITVHPNPIAAFTANPQTTTILEPTITFNDLSQGGDVINWNFGDTDTLISHYNENISHTYADTGTYVITQIVTTQFGCVDSIKETVVVGPEFTFYIPNAFSPNGDGKNDLFNGKGIGIIKYELLIFNRWGELINRIDTLIGGWDGGTLASSEVCQTDVYVWKVSLTDVFNKPHKYIGSVTLLK